VLFHDREALLQCWDWEGIISHSLVFLVMADLNDADLLALPAHVFGSQSGSGKATLARGERYAFVNYGFEY